ncbi:DUF3104 domain-containing protein [Prochlorococcus sp. MIT 1307]|uniref:DUF3104 domain-containing protein n=1 Tax=Prochlorococcus sp. MIT 1307 TaxID=3096219 RepID=UPI002A763A75|nr:DUF3104 domain-containing protein [Prochlorococcus sp. MIT 1307]
MSVAAAGPSSDFLLAKSGDIVVVEEGSPAIDARKSDWWVARVIHVVGSARDPCVSSLLQVACVDTGMIRTINADLVKGLLVAKGLML